MSHHPIRGRTSRLVTALVQSEFSLPYPVRLGTAILLQLRRQQVLIRGRDVSRGVPNEISLDQSEIAQALSEPVARIVQAVRVALEHTQPEIAADIIDEGITMTGGGSLLPDIDKVLADETGLPVRVADNALSCVALGAGRALEDPDYRGALNAA